MSLPVNDPNEDPNELQCYLSSILNKLLMFYRTRYLHFRNCSNLVALSFRTDVISSISIFKYPFLGLLEVCSTTTYGYFLFNIFVDYMVSYITMSIIYFFLLFPWSFLIYSIFFGPASFVLAVLHGILFSNVIACHEIRNDGHSFMSSILLSMNQKKCLAPIDANTANPMPALETKKLPIMTFEFWAVTLPCASFYWSLIVFKLLCWYAISLIPIVGVILLKVQSSSSRGFTYVLPYYKDIKHLDKEALAKIYYSGYARWFVLGLSTGLLEILPIVPGLTICTNSCGCAIWQTTQLKNASCEPEENSHQ